MQVSMQDGRIYTTSVGNSRWRGGREGAWIKGGWMFHEYRVKVGMKIYGGSGMSCTDT